MELKEMTIEQLEERKAAIAAELDAPDADLDALEAEARSIKGEIEYRQSKEAIKAEIRNAVANGEGIVEKKFEKEEKKTMTLEEIRASAEYVNAFANYIKTEDETECRSLLTQNAQTGGQLPVPVLVDEIIRTAWENDQILSRVRKTNFRGNLKVAFERSADPAVVHGEGTDAPNEEALTLGIVTMIPANIKKWIRLSDEAVALGGEAFVRYVYDELTYQIIRKLASEVITDIKDAAVAHSATAVGIPKISAAPGVNTIPTAFANLTDEARDNVVIMNRLTYADFQAAYAAGNFAVDPFMGMTVLYTSALTAYSAASSGEVYAIVGDLGGAQVNYPEGEGVVIKWDDLSEAEADLVKVVGRQYAAHAVTGPGRFVNVAKA